MRDGAMPIGTTEPMNTDHAECAALKRDDTRHIN
jgi:hypothetical protein